MKLDIKQQKELIFIAVVLVITVFAGKKIWDMQNKKLVDIRKDIKNLEKKMDCAGEISDYFKKLKTFKKSGWLTKESVYIMGEISKLASKYSIEVFTFSPGGLKDKKHYFTLSMSLRCRADYFMLVRFISAIEKLATITKVTSLEIDPETVVKAGIENAPLVKANLTIVAFILDDK